jgi:C4-dicarboxylate transporter DctQ subunit
VPTLSQRLHAIVDHLEEGFMAVTLAFMTIITFIQVILRYVFGTGWVWSLEATTYSFAWLVLVGMSYGVRTRAHIAVDLVSNQLPRPARRIMAFAAIALCLLYCGFMIYGGSVFVDRLMTLGNNARDIPLPRWLLTSIMPVAFALLSFRFLQAGWQLATHKETDVRLTERDVSATLSARHGSEKS